MKYNLPKGYLSNSSCDLWEDNPQGYREKYYLKRPGFTTPYTQFGKEFATSIEQHPERYPHIPKGSVGEFPIKWVIEGVPVLGYLDSFEPSTKSIFEYKTSISGGSNPWNQVKVVKWRQLPFYAMCIRAMFKKFDPLVHLVVLETEWGDECKETKFGTQIIRECEKKLMFVEGALDKPKIFKRKIAKWEVDDCVERLVKIAGDISDDYTSYQQSIPLQF